ncbi:MAG: hypothetical protein OIN66_02880 [Candidatus Methanoperedens sp.]|nr:hypothetical protein [Candidatus Methanoperedens sp.]
MSLMRLLPFTTSISSVYPLDQVEENSTAEISTEMREFFRGGIPRGKSIVYYTQPGVEGEVFGMQTAYNTLKNGGICVFIASSTSPGNIKNQFRESGWDVDPFKNRFFFVDAYNPLIGAPSKEKYVITNPENIYEFSKEIKNLLKEIPASTVVFGSLSTIMDLCGERETIEAVKSWNIAGALQGHVLVYNFTAWPYSQETLSLIRKDLFNAVICIGGITGNTILGQCFGVLKSDWVSKQRNPCLSRCHEP